MNPQVNSLSYIGALVGGILVSFSPCVYPLIPITLGFIGVGDGSSRLRGLFLSSIYVFGIAITYSVLGLFASLTGEIFGQISSHPVSYLVVGLVCILFGLSVLEVFDLPLPKIFIKTNTKRGNFWSVFILGLVSGLIVGPCTVPVLGAILVYVAKQHNIIYGTSLLFTFAYAQGLVLILAGTFGGILGSLPKSGNWLLITKKISGIILIIAGGLFLFKAWRLLG